MKIIELTQGKFATVDDGDFERVSAFKWYYARRSEKKTEHLPGYAVRNEKQTDGRRKTVFLHDFIMHANGRKVTFLSGNTLDCRRQNLRFATPAEIQANKRIQINKQIKFRGVRLFRGRYQARIKINNQTLSLGGAKDAETAARLYDDAARKYFGEMAALNFPKDCERSCFK